MAIIIVCPGCGKRYKIKDELVGKRAKCPCGIVIVVTTPSGGTGKDATPALTTTSETGNVGHKGNHIVAEVVNEPPTDSQVHPVTPETSPQRSQSPDQKHIGNVDPVCPYCSTRLEKKPGRKKKCPHCSNYIYVRTRPVDRQKILVTEEQLDDIAEQWAIVNGTHDEFLAERGEQESDRQRLRVRFGHEPSKGDLKWAGYNRKLLEYANDNEWGSYRCIRFDMAEHLRKDTRLAHALSTYLEVCYLDLNGPNNLGGLGDREIMDEFPPFSLDPPELAELAPGVVCYVHNVATELQLSSEHLETRFRQVAERLHSNLRLPRSPDDAWEILNGELEKHRATPSVD